MRPLSKHSYKNQRAALLKVRTSTRTRDLRVLNRKPLKSNAWVRTKLGLGGLVLLAVASLTTAYSGESGTDSTCPFSGQQHPRELADRFFEQKAYERAGECYRAVGDYESANRAFIQASRESAKVGSRQLASDREQAKAQWKRLQAVFHRMH